MLVPIVVHLVLLADTTMCTLTQLLSNMIVHDWSYQWLAWPQVVRRAAAPGRVSASSCPASLRLNVYLNIIFINIKSVSNSVVCIFMLCPSSGYCLVWLIGVVVWTAVTAFVVIVLQNAAIQAAQQRYSLSWLFYLWRGRGTPIRGRPFRGCHSIS